MKETLRHKEAFDYYYSLSEKRSYTEVARKFTVSRTSVMKWSKAFHWQERVTIRDSEVAQRLEKKTNTSIVDRKALWLNILERTLVDAVKKIQADELGIASQKDLIATIDEALKLLGEPERHEHTVLIFEYGENHE